MANTDTYTYEIILCNQKGRIKADSPKDAIIKASKQLGLEVVNIQEATANAYNAATNLVEKNGKAVNKKSISYYNIAVKQGAASQRNVPIIIKKDVGKQKDAFRLLGSQTIPPFLRNAITVQGNVAILHALEGDEKISIANRPVIAWEVVDPSKVENAGRLKAGPDGKIYNVWWKKNADTTLIEKDGKFYTIESPVQALLCTENPPSVLNCNSCIVGREKNYYLFRLCL